MIVYNNQAPDAVNNVGQFGATEGSIGAYKQAAEYAADSKYWALLAESKFGTIDDLIAEVESLYQQGVLMQQDIEALKQDFRDQDARLMQLIAQTNAAVSDAQNALALMDQKLIEVQERLDILLGMSVDVTTLPPGNEASGHFDPNTGVISLGIPQGVPGKDGTVTDLDNAPTGVPVLGDVGFYVDKDDNTVHKTSLENIANLIPSVRSISVNGGPAESGEVALTINKDTVGLSNVENVASYSRQEINDKFDKTTKTYQSKAEADADAQYRQVGEKVLVWEATKYEFYTVAANKTLTPVKTEGRILTVNSRSPDSSGNIDITIPTGNPSLYLGEMVMFPYDPTKNISYPGVLPADGRLVSKESALDLGPSLISGQLPVVSETEWQAGARQYFSWGKLADEVTDADSTNFISIRLPDWTGGEAIRAPDSDKDAQYKGSVQAQKPYVVTVNNLAPDEITGNVNISRSILGAASSGANSDITSLSGLTTALSVAQGGTGSSTITGARENLQVDRVEQDTNETRLATQNKNYQLTLTNAGTWGLYRIGVGWRALDIGQGGTGAVTAAGARYNLLVDRLDQSVPGDTRINSSDASKRLYIRDTGEWGCFDVTAGQSKPLAVAQGGTGQTTASAALTALGGVAGDAVRAYIRGFNFQCTTNQVTVGPGEANINGVVRRSTGNLVVSTGTLTVNAWYHVYLYWGGSSVAAEIVSTPPTVAAYPAFTKQGDTSRRYIGSIRTNAAGALIPQISTDGLTTYLVDAATNSRLVAGGVATTATVFSAASRAYNDNTLSLRLACSNGDTTASNSSLAVWSLGGTSRNGTLVSPGTRVVQDIPCTNPSVCYYQMTTTPSKAAAFIDLIGYSYAR